MEFRNNHATVFEEYQDKQFAVGILQINAKTFENEQKSHFLVASNGDLVGKCFS